MIQKNEKINLIAYDSPVGKLMIACSQAGLVSLTYLPKGKGTRNLVKVFSQKYGISEGLLEVASNSQTKKVVKQLDKYFSGRLQTWDLELDWQLVKGFRKAALSAAAKIPYGVTRSYGELAAKAKNPKAARAVGTAMAQNPFSIVVPCHRVVRSGGEIGNYGGGSDAKMWLLDLESKNVKHK